MSDTKKTVISIVLFMPHIIGSWHQNKKAKRFKVIWSQFIYEKMEKLGDLFKVTHLGNSWFRCPNTCLLIPEKELRLFHTHPFVCLLSCRVGSPVCLKSACVSVKGRKKTLSEWHCLHLLCVFSCAAQPPGPQDPVCSFVKKRKSQAFCFLSL